MDGGAKESSPRLPQTRRVSSTGGVSSVSTERNHTRARLANLRSGPCIGVAPGSLDPVRHLVPRSPLGRRKVHIPINQCLVGHGV
jgi:hypothetical protein